MIRIDRAVCDQCGTCVGVCPSDAIALRLKVLEVNNEKCTGCQLCVRVCPVEALGGDDA